MCRLSSPGKARSVWLVSSPAERRSKMVWMPRVWVSNNSLSGARREGSAER